MNHLDIVWTGQFKKDYKLAIKRHLDIELLDNIIRKRAGGEQLPEKNKDHALTGNWAGHRECHIQPDWLLVYLIENVLNASYSVFRNLSGKRNKRKPGNGSVFILEMQGADGTDYKRR